MNNKLFSSPTLSILIIFLLGLALLFTACKTGKTKNDYYSFYETVVDTSKPIAWGEDRDIYVFADEADWKYMQETLTTSLEREVTVVVKERYFKLIRGDINKLDELIKYKNLLFMGYLDSKGTISNHIKSTMPKHMVDRVKSSGADMFVARNRWVKDQVVVYMVGSTQEKLSNINIIQSNRLYTLFLNRLGDRLAYQAYRTKLIPDEFFEPYPFKMKIPENYKLFMNDEKNRFLSFLYRMKSESRDFPDKYISIYYQDMQSDSTYLEWIINKRKELASKYYDKDEFDPLKVTTERINFGDYTAWKIVGPWKNKKHDIGGGFQTIAFYDQQQKKAYLIDNVVYYPAGDKLPVLLELQKISATIKTK